MACTAPHPNANGVLAVVTGNTGQLALVLGLNLINEAVPVQSPRRFSSPQLANIWQVFLPSIIILKCSLKSSDEYYSAAKCSDC